MSDKYLYIGDHGETLAGGLRVNSGDPVPAGAVDETADAWLIDEGLLIEPTKTKKETSGASRS